MNNRGGGRVGGGDHDGHNDDEGYSNLFSYLFCPMPAFEKYHLDQMTPECS